MKWAELPLGMVPRAGAAAFAGAVGLGSLQLQPAAAAGEQLVQGLVLASPKPIRVLQHWACRTTRVEGQVGPADPRSSSCFDTYFQVGALCFCVSPSSWGRCQEVVLSPVGT